MDAGLTDFFGRGDDGVGHHAGATEHRDMTRSCVDDDSTDVRGHFFLEGRGDEAVLRADDPNRLTQAALGILRTARWPALWQRRRRPTRRGGFGRQRREAPEPGGAE